MLKADAFFKKTTKLLTCARALSLLLIKLDCVYLEAELPNEP